METYYKAAAFTIIAVVLWLILNHYNKNYSVLLSVAVCCMLIWGASEYLESILSFLELLRKQSGLDEALLRVLLRTAGVALLTELISLICTDAGNAALGKALTILSSMVIVWSGLPVFRALLDLVSQILGEL